MPLLNYTSERDRIIEQFSTLRDFSWNEQLQGQFAVAGASLSNFLPGIDASKHAALFAGLLAHKKLAVLEQGCREALDSIQTEGAADETLRQLRKAPAIICTFHTGSYRLLNLFLGRHGIPFTLVAGQSIIEKEGELMNSIFNEFNGRPLHTINASDPRSAIRMLRELREGRSLVFYIDGNAGSGTVTRDNLNSCIVPFLASRIHARKGIATLAIKTQVPVYPIISYRRDWQQIRLRFLDPVIPPAREDHKEDVPGEWSHPASITGRLYQVAEPLISLYPEQWEAWLYLHKSAVTTHSQTPAPGMGKAETRYRMDRNSFSLLTMGKKHFLMRKNTYASFEIEEHLYNLLSDSDGNPITAVNLDQNLVSQLRKEHVLIDFSINCRT